MNDAYVDGELHSTLDTLDQIYNALGETGGTAWIALSEPDTDAAFDEIVSLAEHFDLNELAVDAILFTPTLIGAIQGMNFDTMPELH